MNDQSTDKHYRYLFGPVPSRRFGRSLGVDLTPLKTCSLDCIFCQLGRTRHKTVIRERFVPADDVLAEIDDWGDSGVDADHITLSGSGEPTLHAGFGDVLAHLKKQPIPSVLLTNGTLLHLEDVRKAAALADIVKVSFSAWDPSSFEWVNRPHPDVKFDHLLNGLSAFRPDFQGQLWIEVFLVLGINSNPGDVEKIAAHINPIHADRIHLNTVVRPAMEDFAVAVPQAQMQTLVHYFDPPARIIADVIAGGKARARANENTILGMLKRRPCTMQQIEQAFGMHVNEASKYLGILIRKNCIHTFHKNKEIYYVANTPSHERKVSQ